MNSSSSYIKFFCEVISIFKVQLYIGDDFSIIQQEIIMMKDCKHANIVAYFGSYLR